MAGLGPAGASVGGAGTTPSASSSLAISITRLTGPSPHRTRSCRPRRSSRRCRFSRIASPAESMNCVSTRSSTTSPGSTLSSLPMRADSFGAVSRSSSPVTATVMIPLTRCSCISNLTGPGGLSASRSGSEVTSVTILNSPRCSIRNPGAGQERAIVALVAIPIVVLEGDQTGQELLEQALRVLDPDLLGLDFDLTHFDLSLEHRRATSNQVVIDGARAMVDAGLGLKAATITPEGVDDVGSPNRIL